MHTNRLILLIILILLGLGAFVFLAGVLSGPVTRLTGIIFNATGVGYRSGDVPGQVLNLTGVAGDGQVTLIWSPPRGGESLVRYYKVYRGTDAEEIRFHAQTVATAFSDTGLRNGTAYYYRVSAVSDAGEGVLSGVVGSSVSQVRVASITLSRGEGSLSNEVRLVPRGAVSRVTVESSNVSRQSATPPRIHILAGVPGDGFISLAWSLSSTGGVPVSYRLYRRVSGGGEQLFRALSESFYIDRDVTNGVSYTYRVVAINSAGESPSSNEVTFVPNGAAQPPQSAILTVPSSVTNLTATPGNGQVYLLWSEPYRGSAPIVFYRVYRGYSHGNESAIATTATPSWTDSSVSNGTTYYYRVSAVNSYGESSSSNRVAATPQGYTYTPVSAPAPVSVTNLTATAGEQSVSLIWTAPSGAAGPISYRIYRSSYAGGYAFYASTASQWYTDTSVTSGTTYHYYVTVMSSSGEGASSNTVVATPFTSAQPIGQVTNLAANPTNPTDGRTVLSWSSASGAAGYRVYRSGGGASETLLTSTSGTSYTDTGLVAGQSYTYRVRAYGASGEGAFSNYAYVTTEQNTPGTVTDLRVESSGDGFVDLVWSRPSGPLFASTFRILRGTVPGGETPVSTLYGLRYLDSSVQNGVTYYYRVQAINPGSGPDGLRSNTVSATPAAPIVALPGQVTNLAANPTNPTDGRTVLSWSSASGAAGYRVYRSGGGASETLLTSTSGTSYTDTGLVAGQSYTYRVRAYGASGEGAFSNGVSVLAQQTYYVPPPVYTPPPVYIPPPVYTPPSYSQTPDRLLTLNFSSTDGTQVSLRWAVTSYGVLPVTQYRLFRGFAPYSAATYFDLGFATSYTDYSLVRGQTYYYWVSPMNGSVEGTRSNMLVVTIPFQSAYTPPPTSYTPTPPASTYTPPVSYTTPQPQTPASVTGLVADASQSGYGRITLRWSPASGATSYILRRGAEVLQTGATSTSFTDTSWGRWNASYTYSVEALNSAGSGPSATASATGNICGGLADGASCGASVYRSGGKTSYACRASQCVGTWAPASGYVDNAGAFFCRAGQTWLESSWSGKTGEWYVNSSCN